MRGIIKEGEMKKSKKEAKTRYRAKTTNRQTFKDRWKNWEFKEILWVWWLLSLSGTLRSCLKKLRSALTTEAFIWRKMITSSEQPLELFLTMKAFTTGKSLLTHGVSMNLKLGFQEPNKTRKLPSVTMRKDGLSLGLDNLDTTQIKMAQSMGKSSRDKEC